MPRFALLEGEALEQTGDTTAVLRLRDSDRVGPLIHAADDTTLLEFRPWRPSLSDTFRDAADEAPAPEHAPEQKQEIPA